MEEDILLNCDFKLFGEFEIIEHIALENKDCYAVNTLYEPNKVTPIKKTIPNYTAMDLNFSLGKLSWNMIRLKIK
ncbi:Intracellular exo-alpha-(1-_5)-L-arabinofuranosidase [Peribacillus simplex]|nr:Intracellular exo-alpha-(1->5)-L-arabinofuranosidase [Peribacillus simplex]